MNLNEQQNTDKIQELDDVLSESNHREKIKLSPVLQQYLSECLDNIYQKIASKMPVVLEDIAFIDQIKSTVFLRPEFREQLADLDYLKKWVAFLDKNQVAIEFNAKDFNGKKEDVYYATRNTALEDLEMLEHSNIFCNLTSLPQSIKDQITDLNIFIYDFSNAPSYPKLKNARVIILDTPSSINFPELETLEGNFEIYNGDCPIKLPKLKRIGYNLLLADHADIELPELEYVDVTIYADKTERFIAPKLSHVGGSMDLGPNTRMIVVSDKIKKQFEL